MSIDVTAQLMNDPCTREVREPSEREKRQTRRRRAAPARWVILDELPIIDGLSRDSAHRAVRWLVENGSDGVAREYEPGAYRVERTR